MKEIDADNGGRYIIEVLAQRSEQLMTVIEGGMHNIGTEAEVCAYSGRACHVLAAFDTRLPVRRISPCSGCIAVVYSGSSRARRALSGCDMRCITCGTASYDSVTVSSISRGRAMLTVQRELDTLSGDIIEPCELPLRFSGCDIFKALLGASVMLVCGGIPTGGIIELSPKKHDARPQI